MPAAPIRSIRPLPSDPGSPRRRPLARALCLSPLAGLALLLGACLSTGNDGKDPAPATGEGAEARLVLRTAALAGSAAAPSAVDSIAVRVTGDGMGPKDFGFGGGALSVSLVGIPPGANRSVAASLFRAGRLLYRGQALATFTRETRTEINLRCEPQFSRVVARFHLPPTLPLKVADGNLTLAGPAGEFTARLARKGEFGTFLVEEVPGDVRYDVSLVLLDAAGKAIYESRQAGLLLPLGAEAAWDLNLTPTEGIAGLVIELPEPREAKFGASFPSRLRKPGAAGEAVLTELYAAPSAADSASEGEWWEIFNRTPDSLDLSGCRLTRARGSAGATQSFAFAADHRIPPGRARTFGRAHAKSDFHYGDFSLVNTASPLLLLCAGDSVLVDSLRYSSTASDSAAVPVRDGFVTTLRPDSLANRNTGASWCLTRTPPALPAASPGWISECGG